MPRIQLATPESSPPSTTALLDAVKQKLGAVPNLVAAMANSEAVAKAYLGFSETLSHGALPARLREQLALVVGETNGCHYCVAAHTALGKMAGLSEQETCDARTGAGSDEKGSAALIFAQRVVKQRGLVSDEEFQEVRDAGYTDGEIGEIVAHVALNIFTNYFNHVAGTEIDFPQAPALAVA